LDQVASDLSPTPDCSYLKPNSSPGSLRLRGGGSWRGGGYRSRGRRSSLRRRAAGLGRSRQLSCRRITNFRRCRRRLGRAAPRTSPSSTLRAPRRSRRVRHARLRSSTNGNSSITSATLSFNHNIHVQLGAELEACSGPGAEVVAGVDGAADVHGVADGPVLLEIGVVAFDRGRVGALLLPDLVGAAVALVAAVLRCAAVVGRVVVAHRFDDVVLDERVVGPAVEGEVGGAVGLEGAGVAD
jgi:hypothetical protein